MTENIDSAGGISDRRAPTRARAELADLTLIVRPPGRPAQIRAFTDAEQTEARAYATEAGTVVTTLDAE
ncbi:MULTISPECIES: hypothetical protein [Gordonia]|uniref:hypothetical protein n=1 Tax=Gordonia TaxID=2053 RepID=UPI0001DDAA5E|nr:MULTISPECIES: hypothetical protein [Gordonia]ADK68891.1 hypothetical protein KTR9_4810 [Gordonia sp. KTR9]MCZ4581564.1 hypothetical protein [Gordonia amicalis]